MKQIISKSFGDDIGVMQSSVAPHRLGNGSSIQKRTPDEEDCSIKIRNFVKEKLQKRTQIIDEGFQ